MYEKTFIIEYIGGMKGDLLTTFLNNREIIFEKYNKTKTFEKKLNPFKFVKNFDASLDAKLKVKLKKPPLNYLINYLDETKEYKFTNSFEINYLNDENYRTEFVSRNIIIKKIIFEKKYYKTISLESIFKNFDDNIERLHNILKKNNLKYNSTNIMFAINKISEQDQHHFVLYNKFKKNLLYKNIVNYEDLYVNFCSNDSDLSEFIKTDKFKTLVEKSWLPDNIEVFGCNINLPELGYRNF